MGYSVTYGEQPVARIVHGSHDRLGLRFEPEYCSQLLRPILSLSFEDDLRRDYWGPGSKRLPNFLGNLLPEGQLRTLVSQQHSLSEDDEPGLLTAIGNDLPGAVAFQNDELETLHDPSPDTPKESETDTDPALRFSLAGVQLKFSMLMKDKKLHLPARGQDGDWIVKLSFGDFPGLPENEHAVMTWARLVGFEVPETRILEASSVSGLTPYVKRDFRALAVKRYDRTPNGRIHQEDFAQVLNRPPSAKYEGKAEQLLIVVQRVVGYEAYEELLSRMAFSISSGNFDAHLKNWSLTYPDPTRPTLSPLYDQVATVAWPQIDRRLATSFLGVRRPEQLTLETFGLLAKKLGGNNDDSSVAMRTVRDTICRARETWCEIRPLLPPDHAKELIEHWKRTPLLSGQGILD